MEQRFVLEITPEVQEQIRHLCEEIHDVEWSGILLYDTEGEFGNKDFRCKTRFLIPMNKGTKAYTEFETGTEVMSFLMDNNEFLDCKQGLSHSHNSMSVYFSGQDNLEIIGNAPFHNYYLSLIVNNKNEMCAKIASVGKVKEQKILNFEYTSDEGVKISGNSDTTVEKEVVFLYNCDIQLPNTLETRFTDKVKAIIAKEAEEAKLRKPTFSKTPYMDSYKNYENKFSNSSNWYDKADIQQMEMFDTEREDVLSIPSTHSTLIEGFVSTLIAQDSLNTDSIGKNLYKLKKHFGVCKNAKNEVEVNLYLKGLVDNYDTLYHLYFEDPNNEAYDDTFEEVVDIFEEYSIENWCSDLVFCMLNQILEAKMLKTI